jgi:outer membrane protein OmpA-like peptidoglycan-associated protein
MKKIVSLIAFCILFNFNYQAQLFGRKTISIADCSGSVNITESGVYTLQFIGNNGYDLKSFEKYTKDSVSRNLIWSYFDPGGLGSILMTVKQSKQSIYCFETSLENPCNDILTGKATLIKLKEINDSISKWDFNVLEKKMYVFIFSAPLKSTEKLTFDFSYIAKDIDGVEIRDEKRVDLREKSNPKYTYIRIRNARTKKPISGNLTISGSKDVDGYYITSDLFLTLAKGNKSFIKTDVRGYFSKDLEYKFNPGKIDTITIDLEPLTIGATAQFEEIEFYRGTSTIMKGSEKKLKRLVDFMALNATVSIEIQGHVNDKSKINKPSSVRLSKKRAKRVRKYLIYNGIYPSRMTFEGYGNTKPIFPNPKQAYEEQANRRVEIVIK